MAIINSSPLGLTFDSLSGNPGPDYPVGGKSLPSKFNHPDNKTISFTPWPSGNFNEDGVPNTTRKIHDDKIYDVRTSNVIEVLDSLYVRSGNNTFYPMKLKPIDFAYLKYTGVYPNNRLMVARRFGSPVSDDPLTIGQNPISTLVSWVPDGDNFISFEVGEDWVASEADFTKIFNDLGGDIGKNLGGSGLGDILGGGAGAVPLPGFTEIFQRRIMEKLKIIEPGSEDIIPSGTPNLIKEAKRRKTVDPSGEGSSLKANFSIKMVCEWEQKFISGIDPTIAWMDIMNMVMRFSTSNSIFYLQGQSKATTDAKKFINKLSSDPLSAIQDIVEKINESMASVIDEVSKAIAGKSDTKKPGEDKEPKVGEKDIKEALTSSFKSIAGGALKGLALKYKVRLIGVINALTGAASTPWHVTIGNPMRPIFCSGDMLVESVTITLGSELAFNDLPSTIKAEFTLKNARNLGMQEILGKFNVGYLRTVKVKPDIYESNQDSDFIPPDGDVIRSGTQSPPVTTYGDQSKVNANFQQNDGSSNLYNDSPGSGVSGTGDSGQTRIGNMASSGDFVISDANSPDTYST